MWAQLHVEMPRLTLDLSRKQSSCIVGPQFLERMCFESIQVVIGGMTIESCLRSGCG